MSNAKPIGAIVAVSLLTTGCMTLPGRASCVFGGATAAEEAYCARVNFGVEGELYAAASRTVAGDCKAHVLATASRLRRHRPEALVSCPSFIPDCHASTLVHTDDGDYVVDNGALRFPGNVMTIVEYRDWVGADSYQVASIEHIRYLASQPGQAMVARAP